MTGTSPNQLPFSPAHSRPGRAALLLAGWLVPAFVLWWRALIGWTVLLPLDLLALPNFYLPRTSAYADVAPNDPVLSDLVLTYPFGREFCARELRAGRIPLWDPYDYAGVPLGAWIKFSPFEVPYYLAPTPRTLVWVQLLENVVCGWGAYLFFRKLLGVSFWPAAWGAWCAPWTGFLVLWRGYPLTPPVALLPWLLLATDGSLRQPRSWRPPLLAAATALVLLCGTLDIAGQTLIVSGLYALWQLGQTYRRERKPRQIAAAGAATLGAWTLGFLLAAPHLWPLLEYASTGSRMAQRAAGAEERPPVGLSALPQVVVPHIYGKTARGSLRITNDNELESSAGAYAGLVATLFLAPAACCRARSRGETGLLWLLCWVGLAWSLDVPLMVPILRLPVLNMFSHNRLVFASSFALVSLAVMGLETLRDPGLTWRGWFLLPALVPAVLAAWLLMRAFDPPEALVEQRRAFESQSAAAPSPGARAGRRQIRAAHLSGCLSGAVLCGVACGAWLGIRTQLQSRPWFRLALGGVCAGELLGFGYGENRQSDRGLYYPRIRALERLSAAADGRVLGAYCLPPRLNQSHGLRDVRGYDAVDPAGYVELLELGRDRRYPSPDYARTQWFMPKILQRDGLLRFSPVLDLLGVRYVISRHPPPPGWPVLLNDDDYWIVENERALPRVFVPRQAVAVADAREQLSLLARDEFDPLAEAYVDDPLALPDDCVGQARIVSETPTRVDIALDMQTAGLVVISDMWDAGWQARLEGSPAPVLRVDHALRGVVAPAGRGKLVFSYEPASFWLGLRVLCAGLVLLALWLAAVRRAASARPAS